MNVPLLILIDLDNHFRNLLFVILEQFRDPKGSKMIKAKKILLTSKKTLLQRRTIRPWKILLTKNIRNLKKKMNCPIDLST